MLKRTERFELENALDERGKKNICIRIAQWKNERNEAEQAKRERERQQPVVLFRRLSFLRARHSRVITSKMKEKRPEAERTVRQAGSFSRLWISKPRHLYLSVSLSLRLAYIS